LSSNVCMWRVLGDDVVAYVDIRSSCMWSVCWRH